MYLEKGASLVDREGLGGAQWCGDWRRSERGICIDCRGRLVP